MAMKKTGPSDTLNIRSVTGCSTALNGQKGFGAHKPVEKGNVSPGGTNPGPELDGMVPVA